MSSSGPATGSGAPFAPPDRFELKRKIGEGGMGTVYEAWDRDNGVRVALKTGHTSDAEALTRFKTEFRSLTEVVHPNLVALYEMISTGDQWFFSMEYVEGTDCLSWIRRGELGNSPATAEGDATKTVNDSPPESLHRADAPPLWSEEQFNRLRSVLTQIMRGLEHLHGLGKLHCDIKPSNVHVTAEGRVVILDFGLVHDSSTSSSWEPRRIAGTPGYMAPEQASGQTLSPATDWFSVGAMLFEALTGRRHSKRITALEFPAETPPDLTRICAGLLDRDPAVRLEARSLLHSLHSGQITAVTNERSGELIGREEEIETLLATFQGVVEGKPAVVFLHGASGMGKSELCRRFATLAEREANTLVIHGRCYEQERVPFKAIDGVADMLGIWLASLASASAGKFEPRNSAALSRIFPALTHPAFRGDGREPDMEPVELRRRAFRAFRDLLARIGDHKRLIVIIDDIQWGDLDSAALLRETLRPPDSPDLMLILCYRSEDRDSPCVASIRDAEIQMKREIALQPLDRERTLRLAGSLLSPDDPEGRARAEAIADECGGNPYLAMELAQHSGRQTSNASLDDVLWRRVEELPADARGFLEVVSVAARAIQKKDAFAAAGLESQDPAIISLLRGNRLLRAGDSVETYHDRIRETVTSRISKQRLRACHHSLALALESSHGGDAEQLALHFDRAGEFERALPYYVEGGEAATASVAFERAASLYSRSLELLAQGTAGPVSRGQLLTSLAHSYANAGRGKEAADTYELAAAEADNGLDALSLRRHAAYQYSISGYLDEGRAVFRDVLKAVGRRLPPPGLRIVPYLMWSDMQMRFSSLRYREPRTATHATVSRADTTWSAATGFGMVDLVGGAYFSNRAALDALRCGDPHRILRALAWRACVICNRGMRTEPEVAKLLDTCRGIQTRHPSDYGEGMIQMAVGITDFQFGRKKSCLEHLLKAEDIFVTTCPGTYWERTSARMFICFCLMNQGQLGELRARAKAILQTAREHGDRFTYAMVGTGIGHIADMAAGRIKEARAIVDGAVSGWQQQGITVPKIYAMWASHQLHSYTGEGVRHLPEVDSLIAEARGSMISRIESFRMAFIAIRCRGLLSLAEEGVQVETNLKLAEREVKRLLGLRSVFSEGFAHGLLAGIRAARGDRPGAILSLTEAIRLFEMDHLPFYSMPMRLRLGQITEGEAGLEMECKSYKWMREIGAVDPYRFSAVWVAAMARLVSRPRQTSV